MFCCLFNYHQGAHLNEGVGEGDYVVTIEGDPCDVTSVNNYKLYCTPKVTPVLLQSQIPRQVLVCVPFHYMP